MIRFSLLGSGSKGNALFISSAKTKILIDNGFSFKQLRIRVESIGESLEGLDAVFVTHEHRDHVGGIGVLSRKIDVPIYFTPVTYECLPQTIGQLQTVNFFEAGDTISVGDLKLTSFSVSHDAVDPVGFAVTNGTAKIGLATDLGHAPTLVKKRLEGSNALILEANHCPVMLRKGPYPLALQQRIKSKHGHLSNSDMISLLSHLLHEDLKVVVLAHVSEENNSPENVYDMTHHLLKDHKAEFYVADQNEPTKLFEIG